MTEAQKWLENEPLMNTQERKANLISSLGDLLAVSQQRGQSSLYPGWGVIIFWKSCRYNVATRPQIWISQTSGGPFKWKDNNPLVICLLCPSLVGSYIVQICEVYSKIQANGVTCSFCSHVSMVMCILRPIEERWGQPRADGLEGKVLVAHV